MGILRIGILGAMQPRTTLRHSGVKLVRELIHPLLGMLAHLARKLVISPWLVGVRSVIPTLLGGVESSCERDITKILSSPRNMNARRLVPTRLWITAPWRGSSQRNISSPDDGLLIRQVRNKWPQLRGLLILWVPLSIRCGWIKRDIAAPHLLELG